MEVAKLVTQPFCRAITRLETHHDGRILVQRRRKLSIWEKTHMALKRTL